LRETFAFEKTRLRARSPAKILYARINGKKNKKKGRIKRRGK
jgi:hypothetical protein